MATGIEESVGGTHDFLHALFDGKPDGAGIQIWIRADKSITWFVNSPDTAADLSQHHAKQHDVYVGCGLSATVDDKPLRTRLKADQVAGICGTWADIDVNGGPDDKRGAAPSFDVAHELASSLLEPTVLVHSGYGLQAWWLFEEGPWIFSSVQEREQAKRIVGGFQGALRAAARRLGFTLDAVQDLSRVMRMPGTYNHKGDEPVATQLLEADGKRYGQHEIAELGQGYSVASVGSTNGHHEQLEIRHGATLDKRVKDMMRDDPDFEALWEMKRSAAPRNDKSPSGFEFKIACEAFRAGLDEQAVADVLVRWRLTIGSDDPQHGLRPDRISRTVRGAKNSVAKELEESLEEQQADDAVERLDDVRRGVEEPNEAKHLAAFNQIIGGPAIARVTQTSRDPRMAHFIVELEDGREVVLGKFDQLMYQDRFRAQYGVLTGHYPKRKEAKQWDKAIAGLLKIVIIEETQGSFANQMEEWIEDYMNQAASHDRNGACETGMPFREAGYSYLTLTGFIRYLRTSQGERVSRAELTADLNLIGFAQRSVNYVPKLDSGKRTTRSYFTDNQDPGRVGRPPKEDPGCTT